MPTVVEGDFEWDSDKAASNLVHVERGERDRIISARPATGPERDVYETGGDP
jgi:uncharacterized DUF497 family protein